MGFFNNRYATWCSRHGVGYDNIDLESTKKNNITLAITATANAVAVAEHVMFMLLNISKKGNMYDETVKSGKFNDRNKLPKTVELWNKNILIAGFGRIGQALIKRCHGFEMKVFVYDPFVSKEIIEKHGGIKVDSLEEASKTWMLYLFMCHLMKKLRILSIMIY